MDLRRVRALKEGVRKPDGPVVYWMSRDQRAADNWALFFAQQQALAASVPLHIVFCLAPRFLDATIRQYRFMVNGLKEVEVTSKGLNIRFSVMSGQPELNLPFYTNQLNASLLVTDFDPLRIKRGWTEIVAAHIDIPFYQVDASNIVPVWVASQKQEFSARTLRPKIRRLLQEFLEPFPALKKHPFTSHAPVTAVDWKVLEQSIQADRSVGEIDWLKPGEQAGLAWMVQFVRNRLSSYAEQRNDPCANAQSGLSPYLHYGQISSQRLALEVLASEAPEAAKDAFLEELIVRRELSDNYCFYNPSYDSPEGFPSWAAKTLDQHRADTRPVLYDLQELEEAQTYDQMWNAAQMEMVKRGKMHGYMRMYWAKKLLEWTESPAEAQRIAVYLNDKYEIDGRDSNGYTGIAWSIGGVHDRPWQERPIFGKVRYMSEKGLARKFDTRGYIAWVKSL